MTRSFRWSFQWRGYIESGLSIAIHLILAAQRCVFVKLDQINATCAGWHSRGNSQVVSLPEHEANLSFFLAHIFVSRGLKFALSNSAPWSYNGKIWDQVIIPNAWQIFPSEQGIAYLPKEERIESCFSMTSSYEGRYEIPESSVPR